MTGNDSNDSPLTRKMASAADPKLRWGRPKNASAPPWRSQQSQSAAEADAPPWRRRKELRNESQVSMQQGGSSASDSRPVPPEDKEEIIEPECVIEKVEIPKAEVPPAETVAEAPPSEPALATKDTPRVFEIGEKVRYWSGTHAKWVEAHVQRINRGPDGDLISYDLTAKAQADISRVKDASTAEDAPPPVAPPRVVPLQESTDTAAEKATLEKFEKGAEVQYFSETRERWIDATVEDRHEKDGAVTYDLNCKKGVPAERLRNSNVQYTVGEQVEYWSASSHRWMPAIVEKFQKEAKTCDLSVKPGAPLSRVRKAPGSAVPHFFKARVTSMSHGVGVPPPPLACSFKGGDQVQYYSESKQRWMETTVIRIFEQDGNICYDLDCKKGVFADKVRSSLRASQERYEVGEAVEYWSVSAGRWLSAKVTRVGVDGHCDLDIKLAAPIGRLRRPQVTTGASGPGNSDLFVKPSPPQIELPNLQPPPELPAPVISVPGTAPSPPTPPSPAAPAETPEPEMEPTGPSKDAPKPDQSEASLPSVPIATILPSVPVPPQAVPQSTALDPEPLEPVRKGPRPLPQPKHPISKEAGRNGTFEKAMPPTVVEIADKEEKKERTEVMEEREERQEEEVDYDDDNDDNEDDNDGPDKAESEADEKVDSEPEIKDSPSASQQVIDELKTKDKMEEKYGLGDEPQVKVSEKSKKSKRRHKSNDGHEKGRHRRRRKHKEDPAQKGADGTANDEPRPDPNVANGADRGRRRRRHAPEVGQGHVYHMEPGVEPQGGRRRLVPPGPSPGEEVPVQEELSRAPAWNSDRGGRRRAPPGATAKALPKPLQRDVRDRDSSRGVCDLLGAQDALSRLVGVQEQFMERDKNDVSSKLSRRPTSASPLKRKIPPSRPVQDAPRRDVRLVSREPSRRHRSRSRPERHHSRGHRR